MLLAFAVVGLFATAFAPSASATSDLPDEDDVQSVVCEEDVLGYSLNCSPGFRFCEKFGLFCGCTCDPPHRVL